MKKIAVIGHSRIIKPIVELMNKQYSTIESIEIEFTYTEMIDSAVEYIKAQLASLDGLVFTGRRPYELINKAMGINIPQMYIKHDRSILLQTILEANCIKGHNINDFSCDSYSLEELNDAFEGFGYDQKLNIHTAPRSINGDNQVWELYAYHKDLYEKGLVSFCMTGVSMVDEKLSEVGIPSLLMNPTKEAINNAISKLLMLINALENSESQIVVLAIEGDLLSEYNLINDNEYQMMLEKSKISKEVYKFAESIQAAVVESGSMSYMLFSTRQLLESVTGQLNNLDVLTTVKENTTHTVSIGIGYGTTAREAKFHATLGLKKAQKQGGNQAFFVKGGQYSDPILPTTASDGLVAITDPLYQVVSDATGISINNIYRLHCIKEQLKKDYFTSGELSKAYGNTRRSMNRIIEKLESSGYAEIEGTRMMSDSGRPTRIIRLKF